MGFDEFKIIETTMTKLEERLLPELRSQQRKARLALLKEDQDEEVDPQDNAYWKMLRSHAQEENLQLRKISKTTVAHYGVSPDVY